MNCAALFFLLFIQLEISIGKSVSTVYVHQDANDGWVAVINGDPKAGHEIELYPIEVTLPIVEIINEPENKTVDVMITSINSLDFQSTSIQAVSGVQSSSSSTVTENKVTINNNGEIITFELDK